MCVCARVCAYECRDLQRPEESVRLQGAGVIGCCEQPVGVLRTKLGSSGKAVSPLNH